MTTSAVKNVYPSEQELLGGVESATTNAADSTATTSQSAEPSSLTCVPCKRRFRNEQARRLHDLRCHDAAPRSERESRMLRAGEFRERKSEEAERFHCPKCSRIWTSLKAVRQHFAKAHGKKDHVCPLCSKRFALARDLKYHAAKKCPKNTNRRVKKKAEREEVAEPPGTSTSTGGGGGAVETTRAVPVQSQMVVIPARKRATKLLIFADTPVTVVELPADDDDGDGEANEDAVEANAAEESQNQQQTHNLNSADTQTDGPPLYADHQGQMFNYTHADTQTTHLHFLPPIDQLCSPRIAYYGGDYQTQQQQQQPNSQDPPETASAYAQTTAADWQGNLGAAGTDAETQTRGFWFQHQHQHQQQQQHFSSPAPCCYTHDGTGEQPRDDTL